MKAKWYWSVWSLYFSFYLFVILVDASGDIAWFVFPLVLVLAGVLTTLTHILWRYQSVWSLQHWTPTNTAHTLTNIIQRRHSHSKI